MSKLWLIGMTQNRLNDLKEIVQYSDIYFDGLIFVDHYSSDQTYQLLETHKKGGKIIQRPYYMQHSHSQNEIFFCRHAKNGDWMFLNDSPERITLHWLMKMKDDIKMAEEKGIGAFYFSGRPYLWQYFDGQEFVGSPHWGVRGIVGKPFSFGEDQKDLYIENKRNEKPEDSYCLHPIKYWFSHNPSNETFSMYNKYGNDVLNTHEVIRFSFRLYCEKQLGISLDSLDGLIDYMKKIESKQVIPSEDFTAIVEAEFRLSELYQLKVLNMDFMKEIVPYRYIWSFINHLKFGNGFSDENYKGTILLHDEKLNTKI